MMCIAYYIVRITLRRGGYCASLICSSTKLQKWLKHVHSFFFSGLQWVSSVSYLKWGFQGLVLAEIPKLTFECSSINSTLPCIGNGTQAIQLYAMDNGSVLDSSLAILASIFAYLFLYFICLKFIPQKPHQM